MSKIILSALAAASKAIKSLPAAPVFDWDERYKMIRPAFEGIPEADQKAKNAVNALQEQHNKTHGDSTQAAFVALVGALEEAGADLTALKRVITQATREDIRPPSAITADECAKAYKSRVGGVALSKVAETMGTSYQNLVIAMRKHMGDDVLEKAKAEIEAKANLATTGK